MNHQTVYILQERGWSFLARGVYPTETAAHTAATQLGLAQGTYEIQETEFHT